MNLRLPGQVFDAETKLNYNYLRDYDPEVGRYTTPDPVGLSGGLNPYTLDSFNRFQANASSTNFADKIAILDKGLRDLGYSGINMALKDGPDSYKNADAASNRVQSLNRLNPTDYVGTILPQGIAPLQIPPKK